MSDLMLVMNAVPVNSFIFGLRSQSLPLFVMARSVAFRAYGKEVTPSVCMVAAPKPTVMYSKDITVIKLAHLEQCIRH